jgi:hypothetical protein
MLAMVSPTFQMHDADLEKVQIEHSKDTVCKADGMHNDIRK